MNIHIIGGGNLGVSIARGLANATFDCAVSVSRRNIESIKYLESQNIKLSSNNLTYLKDAEVVILAVKPKQVGEVMQEIGGMLAHKILISVVTGLSLSKLVSFLGSENNVCVIRAMPNTAIALQESMTCMAYYQATPEQRELVLRIFSVLGKAIFIEETLMDASTVLGACGIAFALRFIRAATQGGIEIGFDSKTAALIATQTVKGAAQLLLVDAQHPELEIDKVTTPQGCTIVGLNEMEHRGFSSSLIKGIMASYKKIGVM